MVVVEKRKIWEEGRGGEGEKERMVRNPFHLHTLRRRPRRRRKKRRRRRRKRRRRRRKETEKKEERDGEEGEEWSVEEEGSWVRDG